MPLTDLSLVAHLFRRAGFGATRAEVEAYAARSYEEIVEDLLHPERFPEIDDYLFRRYYLELNNADTVNAWRSHWIYRMINTRRPLEEKMALFWHHVFATSVGKSEHGPSSVAQIEMFRRNALGSVRHILVGLAKDPAMIYWLDNNENHKSEPNENWGRELLELFSMGVGNYTEQDIKMASRAFTGWTFTQPLPLDPYGRYPSSFIYIEDDHNDGVKTFLGHTGRFNGEDIIDIIVRQPATARFIARHLYNFFVADEAQVPAWKDVPPRDPEAINTLVEAYFDSNADMRSIVRVLFNSDFFKEARFTKIKSPVELVAGTSKLAGGYELPTPALASLGDATAVMGQNLMVPPTVEGWHTGREWIDAGTLNERINFAVNQFMDTARPGLRAIVDRLGQGRKSLSPVELVDGCLELIGPIAVSDETRAGLLEQASSYGELRLDTQEHRQATAEKVASMLQLIVSSLDYQFA